MVAGRPGRITSGGGVRNHPVGRGVFSYVLVRQPRYDERMELAVMEYRPHAYPAMEDAVLGALHEGAGRIVMDLDTIAALDTETLRGLILLLRRARSIGGEVALRSSRADVLQTLSTTALDRVFSLL